jgi:hypothetical protein
MPERKNQHYVPQHYLQGWSTDDYIGVYHLEKRDLPTTHTSNVCSKDYLYGQPPHIESALGKLEEIQHEPLASLRSGDSLNELSNSELMLLLSFVMTQRTRSLFTQKDIEAGDHLLRDGVRDDINNDRYDEYIEWTTELSEDEKIETLVEASVLSIHFKHMMLGVLGHFAIQDLEAVMLRNLTNNKFVTSDIPPVFDNPRFRSQTLAGVSERGLQIFCPIDPTRLLLLYDPAIYSIKSNSQREVIIKSPSVVDELNLLQYHNAENIIMHGGNDISYLDRLADERDSVRRRDSITQEQEIEGETYEIDKIPPYQVPGITPDIPGETTRYDIGYTAPRPQSQVSRTKALVSEIMNRSEGFPDMGLVTAIQFMENLVTEPS